MELPEIRAVMTQFLDTSDLAAAALVCKSWNASFNPPLYSAIQWYNHPKKPSKEGVSANADHVRELYFYTEISEFPLQACTRIEVLQIGYWQKDPNIWRQLSTFVRRNPMIKSVSAIDHDNHSSIDFMEAVSSCSGLREVHIDIRPLHRPYLETILNNANRLEALSIIAETSCPIESLEMWPCFPWLKKLRLEIKSYIPVPLQLNIIRRSPELTTLTWRIDKIDSYPASDISELFKTHCPFIEHLNLQGEAISDEALSRIFDNCRRVTSFHVLESRFGELAFRSLIRHFSYLQELDLRYCGRANSKMVHQILISCPSLVSFAGVRLRAEDFMGIVKDESTGEEKMMDSQPQDWVCTNLEFLTISICGLEGKPQEWQQLILEQLARLKKLTFLSIGPNTLSFQDSRDGVVLRLESGLDILSSLKRLTIFCLDGLWQEMDECDVRWMMKSWPELKRVEGKLHHDKPRRLELEKILKKKDIDLVVYFDSDDDDPDDSDYSGGSGNDEEDEEEEDNGGKNNEGENSSETENNEEENSEEVDDDDDNDNDGDDDDDDDDDDDEEDDDDDDEEEEEEMEE
ncbi:hypothetical protein BGZ65_007646 [Modicella reniformis]|uniref:F-box domain-containing protein n=1 Tax=Modicella reniformis TaxID=1440133 RepID=A0A9P6IUX9_9FUNG|nr:hypothetical protein BGZ65_007646 [Modicella reniformis]